MTEKTKSQNQTEDDYDPHEHRVLKNPMSNRDALIHFLKGAIGTGVLAMPSAFATSGYITGLFLMVIIPLVGVYALHVMVFSIYILAKRKRVPLLKYSEAMEFAVANGPDCFKFLTPIARPFVDFFLGFFHFGTCAVYMVFIAESVKQIVDYYVVQLDVRIHICFLVVPLLLLFSIRQLKHLTPFSMAANGLIFVGFAIVLYYIFQDLPPLAERTAFNDASKIPLFFGTALFALESVGVIIAVEENMATPKSYLKLFGVMNVGMFIVSVLYTLIGFCGYWKYGDDVQGSITLNIPKDDILSQVVKIIIAIAILFSYPLQGFITADIIWNQYMVKRIANEEKHTLYELIMRAILVLLAFVFALAVPNLGLFVSLVGAFCLSSLGFIFPAIMDICICYPDNYGRFYYVLIKDIFIALFGAVGGVIGTYITIVGIVELYA